MRIFALIIAILSLIEITVGQTFQRLGTCPTLGCIFPPDQANFLAGQYFDIRVEVHAPINGSEKTNGIPDDKFTLTIQPPDSSAQLVPSYFAVSEPIIERWNFSWYEDLYAKDAKTPSLVNVAAKAYRKLFLKTPGTYTVLLNYNSGKQTKATWTVRDIPQKRRAKNVLLFIGDGMTTNMITAARLIAHKSINGYYQSTMQLDQFPVLGHQMTHSIDSFITDSANSATALYTGHKSTVNALGVYADSSPNKFDDPKVETIAELVQRLLKATVGIVSTAILADATPAALTAHTRDRSQYPAVIDSLLNGITDYTWTNWTGPDALFGGGANNFYNSSKGGVTLGDKDYYALFKSKGYNLAYNLTQLSTLANDTKALGVFSVSTMSTWLDRNVYPDNLKNKKNDPTGSKVDALNQPGLLEMTNKAIDIVQSRSNGNGWFIMSEAASIDKQMHNLDYDRALGELLELDDTVRASIAKLEALGILNDTLIIVTADHGHGFDVTGSVDSKYLKDQKTDRKKRQAIGTYQNSGLSQYVNSGNLTYSQGVHFPANWDPRYTLHQGVIAFPDHRETYMVEKGGPRRPIVSVTPANDEFISNPKDNPDGFAVSGNLNLRTGQGVHSLTDVPVFALGPCSNIFGGVYNNVDIFFKISECLGLSGYGL